MLAMKLMALTFVRTSELIGARWTKFDLEAVRWDIPAEGMKMRTPHIVPLSKQALEVLDMLRSLAGDSEWLFPGDRNAATRTHSPGCCKCRLQSRAPPQASRQDDAGLGRLP